MNNNFINMYMKFKLKRLMKYAHFICGSSNDLTNKYFTNYLTTYINCYYYKIYATINDNSNNNVASVIEKELNGMQLELLDNLACFELQLSNSEYDNDKLLIAKCLDITKQVIEIDRGNTLNITNEELINLIKETKEKEEKILLNNDNDNFTISFNDYYDNKKRISLDYSIKRLDIYKKNLVNKVYMSDTINTLKLNTLIFLLEVALINKLNSQEPLNEYFLFLDDIGINGKRKLEELFSLIDNQIINDNIVLVINYEFYYDNKIYLNNFKNKYKFACFQDLTHINDTVLKLQTLEALNFFDYIIIDKYKDADFNILEKYEVSSIKAIYYSKGA